MSVSETFNYDNMEKAIETIGICSKSIEEVFNNIYKLQEDFKKYHGGTYFETKFMSKSSMDSYINEIDANDAFLILLFVHSIKSDFELKPSLGILLRVDSNNFVYLKLFLIKVIASS